MLNYRSLLKKAYEWAKKSPDPSTQNGAILVDDDGEIYVGDCNRFPRDHSDRKANRFRETSERLTDRNVKYGAIVHAERAVLFKAAQSHITTKGLIMVCPWAACDICAQCIIEFGIKRLVVHTDAHVHGNSVYGTRKDWDKSIELANKMLAEANVERLEVGGMVGGGLIAIMHAGEIWHP